MRLLILTSLWFSITCVLVLGPLTAFRNTRWLGALGFSIASWILLLTTPMEMVGWSHPSAAPAVPLLILLARDVTGFWPIAGVWALLGVLYFAALVILGSFLTEWQDATGLPHLEVTGVFVFGFLLGFHFFFYFLPTAGWKGNLGLAATVLLAVSSHYLGLYFSRGREVNRWTSYDLIHVFLIARGPLNRGRLGWGSIPGSKDCIPWHWLLRRDQDRRLHCDTGPAVVYADGWGEYFWHGVRVPKSVIMRPKRITVSRIMKEANVEVRRAMMERYDDVQGKGQFLIDCGCKVIDSAVQPMRPGEPDSINELLWLDLPGDPDRCMVALKVIDPSTGREYILRVPPDQTTVRGALAWTFGLAPEDYDLQEET